MTESRFPYSENEQINDTVLIIDGDESSIANIKKKLDAGGICSHAASNAAEALNILANTPSAVILCSRNISGASPSELLQKIQQVCPDAIRIVLCEKHELESLVDDIRSGNIYQYILKPIDEEILVKVVLTSLAHHRLLKENKALHQLIVAQHKALSKTYDILKNELAFGARIQETLLAGATPTIQGCSISSAIYPSRDIDGNFFEFYQKVPEAFDLAAGSIIGSGLPAILLSAIIKTQLAQFALPFIHSKKFDKHHHWQEDLLSPGEIIALLQQTLRSRLPYPEFHVPLFYARFNLLQRNLSYINCGAQNPLFYNAKNKTLTELDTSSSPFNLTQTTHLSEKRIPFQTDDIFVLFSEGAAQARSPKNEPYGAERIRSIISSCHDLPVDDLLNRIKNDICAFTAKDHFEEDVSLIIIKFKDLNPNAFSNPRKAAFSSELSQITPVREFVSRLCLHAPGNTDYLADHMQMAITEIFTNLVKHAYHDETHHKIIITGDWINGGLLIDIADQGVSFNPTDIPNPSLTIEEESGFGWYIIKSIVDEVTYQPKSSANGWNHLKIFKKFIFIEDAMQITYRQEGEALVIIPHSESLDARNAKEFKQQAIEKINLESASKVVLDLSNIQYVDSSGLGSLLSILKSLHSTKGELKLSSLNKPVRTIFELVAMHKIFEIFNNAEDAVNSYR